MCGHRSGINTIKFRRFFNILINRIIQSFLWKFVFFEKYTIQRTVLSLVKSYREREEYWISRIGTAIPYPCNVNIKSMGNLSSQCNKNIKVKLASYLDLHSEIDGKRKQLTKLKDKRKDFSFRIVNFPFICGNMPSAPAYGFFISQFLHYARVCRNCADVLYCDSLLTIMLLQQGYVATRLKTSLQRFYGRLHEFIDKQGVSICTIKIHLFNMS